MKIDKNNIKSFTDKAKVKAIELSKKTIDKSKELAIASKNKSIELASKSKDMIVDSEQAILDKMDVNHDGHVDIEDIIIQGLRIPGIKINRESFLRKEFLKRYSKEITNEAILTSPVKAGINSDEIDSIADSVIQYERNCVSGISAALGAAGGVGMLASIPTDIAQYYGYMLRCAQELMYLYGFPQIDIEEEDNTFDAETLNILILCFGVMFGVQSASVAIKAMANGLSKGIGKKIMSTALTKGTFYPIIKSICKWFGLNMTKTILKQVVSKSIVVVGSIVSGGITYASFKPCCVKLKNSLSDTYLSNPNHIVSEEEGHIVKDIDVSYSL